jgi:hypothetical protein
MAMATEQLPVCPPLPGVSDTSQQAASPPAPGRRGRMFLFIGACCAAPALILVYAVAPEDSNLFPKCFFFLVTGLHCPGCGATRALHALLHGQWEQAMAYNALFLLTLPFVAWYGIKMVVATAFGLPFRTSSYLNTFVMTWLVLALVFAVIRNLPFAPFTLLAPHQL